MIELNWQKSTYSETASSCVYLAATPEGGILLHESEDTDVMLSTGPRQLQALIASLRAVGGLPGNAF
ncbi:DUF397 domain-containing protein [Streptomyces poonensis]|uniref:DUF397 domain-containing protein n=1 Tax=Streptomyces poonensis TaxID=68255 RepID=A0A918P7N3_9ACTN|nr:DUF397 domain-containing protein [Streptomyces poonensis]GGY90543.1 hypothetical protein GCM10010365_06180 [Streptomyces poonensis]GLJ87945.1 hypothetical protein GCM10017589_05450 [Streptomyces poonensis]